MIQRETYACGIQEPLKWLLRKMNKIIIFLDGGGAVVEFQRKEIQIGERAD